MKKLLMLSIFVSLSSSFVGFASFAEEDFPVNKGQVPAAGENAADEMKPGGADVANIGLCKECVKNYVHTQMDAHTDATTYKGAGETDTGAAGDKKGAGR